MTSMRLRLFGVASGAGLDALLGEPPSAIHPVVLFGRAMGVVERRTYRDDVWPGALYAVVGVTLGVISGFLVRSSAVATAISVAGRSLASAATEVGTALSTGDVNRARDLLPSLVGRDPRGLDEGEIARAAVESVAENTVDAIVAPMLWAAVAGAPGALGYRAVNTMDAMVGHRSERYQHYGTASARLDDVANWVPARVCAALVAAVRPRATRGIVRAVRTQAPLHPSPNSGVAEAAFAAALGVSLGGRNVYGSRVEIRPILGVGRPAQPDDIAAAVRLRRDVTVAAATVLCLAALLKGRR
ncbi:MAG: cobalamin biosynthesis protein CobD [Acidobacteriota bacterium]|nr:cobalamin biosynthesis protein CobD [Acidobacteriota bacterium]MDE3082380.1 cobalamin biosynthesis protein CobD [Acidobacteriota bacterium]